MFNLDDITNENNKGHNENWPFIQDHSTEFWYLEVLDQEKQVHCLI